jgi:hypothetical protein
MVGAWLVVLGLAFAPAVLMVPEDWRRVFGIRYLLLVLAGGCLVLIPLDRFFEEKFRRLEKLPERKAAA